MSDCDDDVVSINALEEDYSDYYGCDDRDSKNTKEGPVAAPEEDSDDGGDDRDSKKTKLVVEPVAAQLVAPLPPRLVALFRGQIDAAYMSAFDLLIASATILSAQKCAGIRGDLVAKLVECNRHFAILDEALRLVERWDTADPTPPHPLIPRSLVPRPLVELVASELRCARCIADILGSDPDEAETRHWETSPFSQRLLGCVREAMKTYVGMVARDRGGMHGQHIMGELGHLPSQIPAMKKVLLDDPEFRDAVTKDHADLCAYTAFLHHLIN